MMLYKRLFHATLAFSIISVFALPTIAQKAREADVFAPPSQVRQSPNGKILCTINQKKTITVYGEKNKGWYPTDACGDWGYIHETQVKVKGNLVYYCTVTGIKQGQLALRKAPKGAAIAGLNNNNIVQFIKQSGSSWMYVKVIEGPNPQVNGLTGWVNANYLECAWD